MYGYQERRIVERHRLRIWDWHVYTAIFKIKCPSMGKKKPSGKYCGCRSDIWQNSRLHWLQVYAYETDACAVYCVLSTQHPWKGSSTIDFKKLAWNSAFEKLRSWHPVPSLHGKLMGKQRRQWQTLFSWAPKSLQMVTAAMKLKDTCSLEEGLWPT